MNSTIAGAISDAVMKLLNHTTDLVRKKAVLLLQRIVKIIVI
jgi:vesicle coat complex subunit